MRRHTFPNFVPSPLRWRALLLLALILAMTNVDRAALESMVLAARDTLALPDNGLVVAFRGIALGFGLALPIGAVFAHLAGPRQVLLWSALGCAGATAFMGFAFNLGIATLFYLWLGVAAGMVPGAAIAALPRWFPMQRRGTAVGLVLGVGGVAAAFAWLVLAGLHVRALSVFAFLALGLVGLVWVWAWHRWYRLPADADAEALSQPERPAGIGAAAPGAGWERQPSDLPTGEVNVRDLLRQGLPLLGLAFVQSYAIGLCRDWLPQELLALRHQDLLGNSAEAAAVVWGATAFGCIVGGVLTDLCIAHSHNVVSARQAVIAGGFALGLFCLFPMALGTETGPILWWLVAALFCFGLGIAPLWCGPLDLMPEAPGPLLALLAFGVTAAQFCSPAVLSYASGSWALSFGIAVLLLAGGAVGVFYTGPARSKQDGEEMTGEEAAMAGTMPKMELSPAAFSLARPTKSDDELLLESLRDQGFMKATTRPV
jgi:ACS family hexuronate transporter-like MFS transporter